VISVIAPEPVPWVKELLALNDQRLVTDVFAPWAVAPAPRWFPDFVRSRWDRRSIDEHRDHVLPWPGWPFGELSLRQLAGGKVPRQMEARFLNRKIIGLLATALMRKRVNVVVAPSLAAGELFVKARQLGGRTVLLEDIPDMRSLHADLDAAASVHPDAAFLRRYRAPLKWMVRQERERVLADVIVVRGPFALAERKRDHPDAIVEPWPVASARAASGWSEGKRPNVVLLAGLASARNGSYELLQALDALPELRVLVHAGEGTEPASLLRHPRVRVVDANERARLSSVGAVVAPAWCEGHSPDVARAEALDVPVIASTRAAGFGAFVEVKPGRVNELVEALQAVLDGHAGKTTLSPRKTWAALLGEMENSLGEQGRSSWAGHRGAV
jgi:hypothetical protein